ncbi:CoxG family protein [Pseudolabrys sp.]|uniref:CoxG family protein n=1 Tax=Pseudolabrys sp. TaxID=1960880 RepID=UPI003D0BCF94
MKINQTFAVRRPLAEVWDVLADVPFVAGCLPGATLSDSLGDDRYTGQISVKVGPIQARFSGEVGLKRDASAFCGTLSGRGTDGRTASSAKAEATYRLTAIEDGQATEVDIAAEVSLTGLLAQFGKSAVINEISSRLAKEFAANLNSRLSFDERVRVEPSSEAAASLNIDRLLLGALWAEVQRIFAKCRRAVTGRGCAVNTKGGSRGAG